MQYLLFMYGLKLLQVFKVHVALTLLNKLADKHILLAY